MASGATVASSAEAASPTTVRHAVAAAKAPSAMRFKSSVRRGPDAGEATISWKEIKQHYRTRATAFRIETSLTQFSPYGHGLPKKGRHYHVFKVGGKARKIVLGPKRLAAAGAPFGSAEDLYFRITSIDKPKAGESGGTRTWTDGKLKIAQVLGEAPTGLGSPVTFAQYNVRMAKLDPPSSPHYWYTHRVDNVAKTILSRSPGIATVEELMPWKTGPGYPTTSLLNALASNGGRRYDLVSGDSPTGAKLPKGSSGVGIGQQILYDTTLYAPVGGAKAAHYIAHQAGTAVRFRDLASNAQFWVVSMHLEPSSVSGTAARKASAKDLVAAIDKLNSNGDPVIIGGDQNDWQNNFASGGYSCHDALVNAGYYDTAASVVRKNFQYSTVNHFKPLKVTAGVGARFDVIMTKGMPGASSFENVIKRYDGQWPSDHDMVVAKFRLP
jgi:hypothetical protein